jgi:enoyl-CoA hydratase
MSLVSVTTENYIATVLLNSPPANALSSALLKEISAAFDCLEKNDDIKAVVIRGEGRFFSAGADIKEFTTIENGRQFAELASLGQRVFDRIEKFKKPVIASIHGAALGGGLELAMACHIRVTTKSAKLGMPELTLGLIPGFAGSQRLPNLVGTAKANELLLTSDVISGEEAANLGLVNAAYEDEQLQEKTMEMVNKITSKSSVSIGFIQELLTYARSGQFQNGVLREAELFGASFESHDGQEGIHAFVEKRKPVFKNQ